MKKKLRVAIVFGGASTEHNISLLSAKHVLSTVDPREFEMIPIAIDLRGNWFQIDTLTEFLGWNGNAISGPLPFLRSIDPTLSYLRNTIDVVFPLIHGSPGEDGCIQGFCSLLAIPCVGADVLSSSICMDKLIMKQLFSQSGIPTAKYVSCRTDNLLSYGEVVNILGLPVFVKPSNRGSSLGISKVESIEQWAVAIDRASVLSDYLLFEEYIVGREIECSLLGNKDPIVSLPGEIGCMHNFYSYEAKYVDTQQTHLQVPANIRVNSIREIQNLALQVYNVMRCRGMARVDFFLRDSGTILVNEINTIPGFTEMSLYPKLCDIAGYPLTQLISKLIKLAIETPSHNDAVITG